MVEKKMVLSDIRSSENVIENLREEMKSFNIPQEVCFDIQLAIIEAINNAFLHGCKNKENPRVIVQWHLYKDFIEFKVKDNGPGFNFEKVPEHSITDDILKEQGRGIFLIKQVLEKVWFNQKGNEICGFKSW